MVEHIYTEILKKFNRDEFWERIEEFLEIDEVYDMTYDYKNYDNVYLFRFENDYSTFSSVLSTIKCLVKSRLEDGDKIKKSLQEIVEEEDCEKEEKEIYKTLNNILKIVNEIEIKNKTHISRMINNYCFRKGWRIFKVYIYRTIERQERRGYVFKEMVKRFQ
eukprot:GAHX01002986.1.p1 GENE.GAHX01002986.1~~GAHX01002986.1.p1  ORF type:complete len:176 (+),score=33.04 GAHX01002986.1:45-530(+)